MIYDIVQYPNDILHNISEPVTSVDNEIIELVNNMKETMIDANGIGLSAIQIGVAKRIFVMDAFTSSSAFKDKNNSDDIKVFINPEIIATVGSIDSEEGCLSVQGIYAKVVRASEIQVKYQDQYSNQLLSKFTGIEAICIQHEIDHLNGIVFVEKLSRLKQNLILTKIKNNLK